MLRDLGPYNVLYNVYNVHDLVIYIYIYIYIYVYNLRMAKTCRRK